MTQESSNPSPNIRTLWRQYLPLSVSDVTMAAGDPLITTTLAHLPLAAVNIAAIGVAKALVNFFESPIIMLLHASNALSPTAASRAALRRFAIIACAGITVLLAVLLLPSVFPLVAGKLLGVNDELIPMAHEALLWLLLWPAAIGWRRYYQGLLIRQGHSIAVARAGVIRLIVVAILLAVGFGLGWPGIRVAGLALIGGVFSEALAVTLAARARGANTTPSIVSDPRLPSDLGGVWRFYWPLANSMVVVWGGRAVLVAIIARSFDSQLALAAWPAAWGLTLVVANATRMVQQVIIKNHEFAPRRLLLSFAASVGLAYSLLLLIIGASALGKGIIDAFVGQDAALAASIQPVILLCAAVPLLVAMQNGVQGLLIANGRTSRVNAATWIGTSCLLIVAFLGVQASLPGATVAALAMLAAILSESIWLALGLRARRAHNA